MKTDHPIRVLCVGAGNTGRSHALAYHCLNGFELAGICTRRPDSRKELLRELGVSYPEFNSYEEALNATSPDAVCIATYTDTHYQFVKMALNAGAHVFVEKPLAETVGEAEELIALAKTRNRKLLVGYIIRHHPGWQQFIEIARGLGKPLVMRMNLNQQSSGSMWKVHKNLMASASPIVDCGVHYVDVMCQMTQAQPVRVSGIGARLTDELPEGRNNYGQLQITFDDGSVGWYEAGWGPMISEVAFFVKDVNGPKGSVSILADKAASEGQSANVKSHSETENLRIHYSELDENGEFLHQDVIRPLEAMPDHDALFQREQIFFLKAIKENIDLSEHLESVWNSMRIVLAAEESSQNGETITLKEG